MLLLQVLSTSVSFPPFVLSFLAFVTLHSLVTAQMHIKTSCQDNTFSYTAGSRFEKNLDSLLHTTLSIYGGGSISADAKKGSYPDEVYGLFLCRGDVSEKTCQDCIDAATDKILSDCQFKKEAIIWYDECLIRYSNKSFVSTLEITPVFCVYNSLDLTESKKFLKIRRDMFDNIIDQAINNPDNHMYAKADVNITGVGNLYGMVQCTPELSPLECQNCLTSGVANFDTALCPDGKRGKRILTPSCNTRYEVYPFSENPPIQSPDSSNSTDNIGIRKTRGKTLVTAISAILPTTLVIVLIGCCICYYNRKKRIEGESIVESDRFPLIQLDLIQTATQQFSPKNKLGEGGFGPVYKGTLVDGKEIAVKRLSRNSCQGLQEFKAEVTLIAKLQHNNLVNLLGCCLEGEELLLVYDYMPNKSLDVHLFDTTSGAHLDWKTRLSIINGIARGILYLHEDSRLRIIHRDLKASNILLDSDMHPKISDFGLARIFGRNQIEDNTNRVVGTYGYMAPEYAVEGIFSVKSDVFSFGVLLLEIVSGRKNSRFYLTGYGHSLLTYAWKLWSAGQGLELMDPLLLDTYLETEVLNCIQIGLLCVQEDPADRPTMSSVIRMLGSYAMPIPQPTEPAFSLGRVVPFSQQKTIELGSSVIDGQVVTSSYVKPDDTVSPLTIGNPFLSNIFTR
ncbi:hypothetical protein DCAR_0209176 [Daucus carota subsp. sativus]|uniref:non-specific serine/threonine protein kinase n=1 Tax=Daucus carota subsp. sativus TaxID=79200 RepID=A0AAF0WKS4_DAUCS|nr:hypothetical protein DCAR_0209176 [Daucus carota subsp. sativus]